MLCPVHPSTPSSMPSALFPLPSHCLLRPALPSSLLGAYPFLYHPALFHKHTSGELSAASCKGHFVCDKLGGARTSLAAYDTMKGACLKQLQAQDSIDGNSCVSTAHPEHGVSPRSFRPRRQNVWSTIPPLAQLRNVRASYSFA